MKLSDTEFESILAETRAEFEAALSTAEALDPLPLPEDYDVAASLSELGLDQPIDTTELDALLAHPRTPARTATIPPPVAYAIPVSGSVKISVRIPARDLIALKSHAAARGIPYQRLLKQTLCDAMRAWEGPAGKTGHI